MPLDPIDLLIAEASVELEHANRLASRLGERIAAFFDLPVEFISGSIETPCEGTACTHCEGTVCFVALIIDGREVFRATGDTPSEAIDILAHLSWDAFVLTGPGHSKGDA